MFLSCFPLRMFRQLTTEQAERCQLSSTVTAQSNVKDSSFVMMSDMVLARAEPPRRLPAMAAYRAVASI